MWTINRSAGQNRFNTHTAITSLLSWTKHYSFIYKQFATNAEKVNLQQIISIPISFLHIVVSICPTSRWTLVNANLSNTSSTLNMKFRIQEIQANYISYKVTYHQRYSGLPNSMHRNNSSYQFYCSTLWLAIYPKFNATIRNSQKHWKFKNGKEALVSKVSFLTSFWNMR